MTCARTLMVMAWIAMCILCTFIVHWEKLYDRKKYPLSFYEHFLEQIRLCQNEDDLFTCMFMLLHWKFGKVREGTGETTNTVIIDNTPFTWSSIKTDFEQHKNDTDFLQYCFGFRNRDIDSLEFFKYIKEQKRIFGKSLVLHVFLMHILRPEEYPMIDQHVWRTMKVFQANTKSINQKPETWDDYRAYMAFFKDVFTLLQGENHLQFNRQTIDRAFMAFGKWIKQRSRALW